MSDTKASRPTIEAAKEKTPELLRRKSSWENLSKSRLTDGAGTASAQVDIKTVLGSYYDKEDFRRDVRQTLKYKHMQDIAVLASPYNLASTPDLQKRLEESVDQYTKALAWMKSVEKMEAAKQTEAFNKLADNYNADQMDPALMRVVNAMEDVKNAHVAANPTTGLTEKKAIRINIGLHSTNVFEPSSSFMNAIGMGSKLPDINDPKTDGTGVGKTSTDSFDLELDDLAKPGDFIQKLEIKALAHFQQDHINNPGIPFGSRLAATRSKVIKEIYNLVYEKVKRTDDNALLFTTMGAINAYLADPVNQAKSKHPPESAAKRRRYWVTQEVRSWIQLGCNMASTASNIHGWFALNELIDLNKQKHE